MNFINLTPAVRGHMVLEIDNDHAASKLYISPRLTSTGAVHYHGKLRLAAEHHDHHWLDGQLRAYGVLHAHLPRTSKLGKVTMAAVPHDAATTLSHGEFNRYFMRGLCIEAVANQIAALEVYRAKHVDNPRSDSVMLIGRRVDPGALLAALRRNELVDAAFGLPHGPNSGLSVKIP